jgi:hypothetical protein
MVLGTPYLAKTSRSLPIVALADVVFVHTTSSHFVYVDDDQPYEAFKWSNKINVNSRPS